MEGRTWDRRHRYAYPRTRAPGGRRAERRCGCGRAAPLPADEHTPMIVDIGVHTIILDTVAYAELCDTFNGGHFLHHVPKVEFKYDGSVMKTAHRIAADGWEVDLPLWTDAACGPCHPGNDSH
ncbi:hypothetical protein [Streptomyces decoyicus]